MHRLRLLVGSCELGLGSNYGFGIACMIRMKIAVFTRNANHVEHRKTYLFKSQLRHGEREQWAGESTKRITSDYVERLSEKYRRKRDSDHNTADSYPTLHYFGLLIWDAIRMKYQCRLHRQCQTALQSRRLLFLSCTTDDLPPPSKMLAV
jgi:hypothetical protein